VPILGLLPRAFTIIILFIVFLYGTLCVELSARVEGLVLLGAKPGAATAKLDRRLLYVCMCVPHVIDLLVSCQALPAGVVAHSYGVSQLVESHAF